MKKRKNIFIFASLAIFLAMGCGGEEKEKEKSSTSSKVEQKTTSDCAKGSGKFGAECKPCTCTEHGICNDGQDGDGKCNTCQDGYFGENCESNKVNCQHGTPSLGPKGNGKCASCNTCWAGESCDSHTDGLTKEIMQDNNNNSYSTTCINGVLWMAKNLATNQANDGTSVVCDTNTDSEDGDPNFLTKYGCLYTWKYAIKVCPKGWHLPTQTEFINLLTYAGSDKSAQGVNLRANSFASGADKFGFAALPAGYYLPGIHDDFGSSTSFWSSTLDKEDDSYAYGMDVDSRSAEMSSNDKTFGYSVRCIKD